MSWLSPRDLDSPGVRLFCLPHAGSGAAGFYRWKRQLGISAAVCPVALPGRESRMADPALASVHEIVDGLQAAAGPLLSAPYAIFGHSMGALLAFEWCRRIASEGFPPPKVLFVSGREAPQMPFGHRSLHTLPDAEFIAQLTSKYGGASSVLLDDVEMRSVFLPILRADLRVVETYRYTVGLPLPCPVMAAAGWDDHSVSEAGLAAWRDLAEADFSSLRLPGDHFYHLGEGQDSLLKVIAERLST